MQQILPTGMSTILLVLIAFMVLFSLFTLFLRRRKIYKIVEIAVAAFIAITAFSMLLSGYNSNFLYLFQANAFSELLFAALSMGVLLILLISFDSEPQSETAMFVSFVMLGLFMVAFAYSLIAIIVGLEFVMLSTVFMILSYGKKYLEPALKLFVLGAISTAIFVVALALLLPYDSSLALVNMGAAGAGKFIVGLALVLFVAALSIESAAFPFNLWVPDVYDGAPGNITALMAGINKKVAFIAILEIFLVVFASYGVYGNSHLVSQVFFLLSILTMFFGNLIALVQKNIKRLFAYSSISQAGYIFIGISAATHLGIEASIFYIISHMFMIIGAFAIVFWLESKNIKSIDEYAGLKDRNAFAAISLTILMLSMAGIPPLVGFAGKFALFSSAVYANDIILALIGIANSFLSIYYYAKVINQMFQKKEVKRIRLGINIIAVATICLIFVIVVGIYPQLLLGLASAAASAIGH